MSDFDSIPSAIEAFRKLLIHLQSLSTTPTNTPPGAGSFIIVLDSPSRENEGDLIIAASALTPQKCAFMIHHSSGYLCAPLPSSLADTLDLPPMVPKTSNTDPNRTAYTITVDATAQEVTTGISAHDRALTCRALAAREVKSADFRRPGHVVPLRAVDGGVRARQGHTEAAVEFCRLAGLSPVGVIAELVEAEAESGEDGRGGERKAEMASTGMMQRDGCLAFGRKYGIKVVTIEGLVEYLDARDNETNGSR